MNSTDKKAAESPEEFLSRWSRRKQQAREQPPAQPQPGAAAAKAEQAPVLPPVEGLNLESDYRGFLHPKVDETLRRTALKKLFNDPHFNVMDGLDTYIDDYSVSDPIPEAMLKQLRHAQDILVSAQERRAKAAEDEAEEQAAMARKNAETPAAAAGQIESEGQAAAGTITPPPNADAAVPVAPGNTDSDHQDRSRDSGKTTG